MSRVGDAAITVPSGVELKLDGLALSVKGSKGTLEWTLPEVIGLEVTDGVAKVTRANDERESRALHGLSRALINNMMIGVSEGYTKELELVGVGYRAAAKGKGLELQVGFSHPVSIDAPDGVTFDVPEPTKIIITGIDKQAVGQIAAVIRKVRPPEPYKGKGIRYVGEHVRRKAGKAGIGAA
ncbi:MAG: 50S ribosomal protein L6 [Acidimicrobiia bacterium]|nr:50S ribosomal protein L6 [Acidimicrobiia bacterium]